MNKHVKIFIIGVAIVVVIAGGEWILSKGGEVRAAKRAVFDSCYAVGGRPLRYQGGGFMLCLAPDAIITLDKD